MSDRADVMIVDKKIPLTNISGMEIIQKKYN
jgi:hypothetical protein